jgi:hypothetical protein
VGKSWWILWRSTRSIITGGDPIATFMWDSATDVDFKNVGVREIEPPSPPQ